jgi:Histidine phosphatase superfamily (branch 1)
MPFIDWLKSLVLGPAVTPPGTSPFPPGSGPARLLIMRHGEKTGDKSDPHLSPAGHQRAKTLVSYLPQQFGKPDFLIAAKTSNKSQRPYETLEPLAGELKLDIMDTFDDEETQALVEHLAKAIYAGRFGVISWRHSDIPALLGALGAPDGSYPQPWDDAVYNLIVEMTFTDGGVPRARQIIEPF